MFKYLLSIFIFLILYSTTQASNKDKIIEYLQNTENLNFNFEQNINGKIENGNCTIEYPKKIYCKYKKNNKILVSNGKSLVVRTITSYYKYPLNKTPLNLILDKNYINFVIKENDHEINLFFDEKTFNLIGWQTVDIYQNINVTYLSSVLVNQKIESNLFKLPTQN